MAGALALLVVATFRGASRWTAMSLPLVVFVAVRGTTLLGHPWSGRAFRWWSLLLALVLVVHVAPSRARLRRWAPVLLGGAGALLGLVALAQWGAGLRQAHATMANRNFLAVALAMLLPFALSNGRRLRWLLFALVVAGLVATRSRVGALAATAAFALWALWRRPFWRVPVLVLAPLAVLAVVLAFGRGAVKDRLYWYEAAFDMGRANPVRGVGADGFRREYPPVRTRDEHAISGGRTVHAVHNDYLESFAEGGVPGLLAHLFLLAGAGWAVRRDRRAGPALLAFAVGSLVGLPLRDPALLALAAVCAAAGARRGPRLPRAVPALGSIAVLGFLPLHVSHWLGDRAFGRYLATREPAYLDDALSRERRHPGALLARRTPEDLALLLEMEPHHGHARYWRAKRMADGPAKVRALRRLLLEHDPHHVPARLLLARLVADDDPVQAASLIEGAIAADPRPWAPYAALARVRRRAGALGPAEKALRRAEARTPSSSSPRARTSSGPAPAA